MQGLVVAAAQKSADQGGAFVRAFREPVVDPTPLAPADAELLEQMRPAAATCSQDPRRLGLLAGGAGDAGVSVSGLTVRLVR